MYFSDRFSKEFGISKEKILPFFKKEFLHCLAGNADLKEELNKYLAQWGWKKSVEELLEYWFSQERTADQKLLDYIAELRKRGVKCFLQTNNEKYRTEYLWETVGLKSHFDGIFSSSHLGYKKPEQEFWSAIYARMGAPEKDTILVWDDDRENVESAKNFGFQAELYTDFDSFQDKMRFLIL